eukprot:SAG11_NODE_1336_length_5173_cov_10.716791_3_plen_131_part_00
MPFVSNAVDRRLDPQHYLAGTESGTIHKCSCSYNESYLQDFTGHEPGMPVYKIRWSPFAPNIFLSCSHDWTVKLWKDDSRYVRQLADPMDLFAQQEEQHKISKLHSRPLKISGIALLLCSLASSTPLYLI